MALSPAPLRCDFQRIVDTAHSISAVSGFPVVPTSPKLPYPGSLSSPSSPPSLPPPPPIDSTLSCLALPPHSATQLSIIYDRSASQFRRLSECKLQRAILACAEVNCKLGLPAYDSTLVVAATTEVYLRTVRSMQTIIISTYQENVAKSQYVQLSHNIPRSLSHGLDARSQHLRLVLARHHQNGVVHSSRPLEAASLPFSANLFGVQPSLVPAIPFSSRQILGVGSASQQGSDLGDIPIYKRQGAEIDGFATHASHVYPARYVHTRPCTPGTFTSRSRDFFPAVHDNGSLEPHMQWTSTQTATSVIADLSRLRIDKHASTTTNKFGGILFPTSPAAPTPPTAKCCLASQSQIDTSSTISLQDNRSEISLDVSTFTTTSHRPRRKCLPAPRHRGVALSRDADALSSPPTDMPSLPTFTGSTSSASSTPCHRTPTAVSAPSTAGILNSGPRRRKVAPLPRRQPTTTTSCFTSHMPLCRKFAQPSELPLSTRPSSYTTMSRTPSLASFSSSRPNSPSPSTSDDGLDTPPSSPVLRPRDIDVSTQTKAPTPITEISQLFVFNEHVRQPYLPNSDEHHSSTGSRRIYTGLVVKQEQRELQL